MNDNDKNISITISLPASLVLYLDDQATKKDLSRSRVIRALIRDDQLKNKTVAQAQEEVA